MQTLLHSLLLYKAQSDAELLDAVGAIDNGERDAAAFQSALRILNHIHIVDRIFMANLQKVAHGYVASWSNDPLPLSQLTAQIRETDRWYVDYASEANAGNLRKSIDFSFTDGLAGRMSREEMLAHVVTHSGYHRGEVGRLLPQVESAGMRDVFAGYLHRSDPARRAN